MSKKEAEVKIKPAKGRPMLTWIGKRPLSHVTAFPAQLVETHDALGICGIPDHEADGSPQTEFLHALSASWNRDCRKDDPTSPVPEVGGVLCHGDNRDVLAYLLTNGHRRKVRLIYIDPPFDSGADYVRRVNLRGVRGTAKLDGEAYALGEQIQYTDIWANDNYLQFMYERLLLLKELLTEDGCIYLHCDWNKGHVLRCLLDEVFSPERCLNEIVWKRTSARSDSHTFNHIHDIIYLYANGNEFCFRQQYLPHDPRYIERYYTYSDPDGRRFATIDATQAGLRRGPSGEPWRGFDPATKGNHWKFAPGELDSLDARGRIYWPDKEGGWPRLKSYLDEAKGKAMQSIWTDIKAVNSQAAERGDYPTQKPEALLARIIEASSDPGDIVLDCFVGCGTTLAVAQRLGRRWIGCDINRGAIQASARRLRGVIAQQIAKAMAHHKDKAKKLPGMSEADADDSPMPCQFGFAVYRVNDYDLQVQHNEAVNIACEHIGVERTRSDAYFDGTLGRNVVKIVPFGHPLTPLDLEELRRELEARPDEDRNTTLVCLGIELAAQAWIEDWNRLRKGKSAVNRIEVIELRTDPKYGKFIKHEPATARVKIARKTWKTKDDKIAVEVQDFISPTIIERLSQQDGIVAPKIDDWRAMVDCIMIDTAYDGEVFNVAVADVPEKKCDFVEGNYELEAPKGKTTVAVRITDMLGEEVVVTERV